MGYSVFIVRRRGNVVKSVGMPVAKYMWSIGGRSEIGGFVWIDQVSVKAS